MQSRKVTLQRHGIEDVSPSMYTYLTKEAHIFVIVSSDQFAGPFSTNLYTVQNPDYLAPFYLHVWSTFVRVQTSHLTSQHQRNIQLQRSRTM